LYHLFDSEANCNNLPEKLLPTLAFERSVSFATSPNFSESLIEEDLIFSDCCLYLAYLSLSSIKPFSLKAATTKLFISSKETSSTVQVLITLITEL
jgi:hypothetical protein